MRDKITWDEAYLLDYITKVEFLYIPYIDDYRYLINVKTSGDEIENDNFSNKIIEKIETPRFGYSEISTKFMERYNEGKLLKQYHYNDYKSIVGNLLKELELDTDKFWCLFLFALDYSNSLLYNGITMKATPSEQLQALVDMIENTEEKTMSLNFKVGEDETIVESPIAIKFIAEAIRNQLKKTDQTTIKNLYLRDEDTNTKVIKDSPFIAYFANILLNFFDTQEHIINKRRKGAKHSIKEMDLVGKLVYFSKLSKAESWAHSGYETLKAFLKQYKDFNYPNNISSIYPEFTVF